MRKCDDLISLVFFYQEKRGGICNYFFLMTSVYYVSISRRNIFLYRLFNMLWSNIFFFVNCYFKFLSVVHWKLKYPYWSLCIKVVPSCVTLKMTWYTTYFNMMTSKVITLIKKNLKKFDHDLESSLAIWFIHAPKHLEHPVCSSKYNKR